MNTKTYRADTMAQALADVKDDLGRDAVILHTRRRRGRLLGLLGGRTRWEVTAAANLNVAPPFGEYVPHRPVEAAEFSQDSPPQDVTAEPPADDHIARQMRDIHRMVERLAEGRADSAPASPPALCDVRERLVEQEVHADVADEMVRELELGLTGQELGDADRVWQRLGERVAERIRTAPEAPGPTGRRVVALIGPTGVGKTTTVAKIAADCTLRRRQRVGLVTIDTYRIAAVDQLRTYADIIEVPLQTALTPGELHRSVRAMADADVVLIDTAGRSQNDGLKLRQLRTFLAAAEADEVHLVVSAASGPSAIARTIDRFAPLGANRLLLTKLDEAEAFGVVLNAGRACELPFSYVTTGQDVPDDFDLADAQHLAGLLVGAARG